MEFCALPEGEDILDVLDRAEAAADRLVQPWQAQMARGDYYWQHVPQFGLTVYGEVARREGGHRRMVRAYSAACPYGELGGLHVSQVNGLLTREQFVRARESGFPGTLEELAAILSGDPRYRDFPRYRPFLPRG
ncbi:MAG: hypothetical protein BWY79_02007 [Actinobacteria bacterium ADurb.Bin444]|nr:MAG: hypothetical protein BWY79_02007 [Actinobacteria bacterium ADurb.Bin444]